MPSPDDPALATLGVEPPHDPGRHHFLLHHWLVRTRYAEQAYGIDDPGLLVSDRTLGQRARRQRAACLFLRQTKPPYPGSGRRVEDEEHGTRCDDQDRRHRELLGTVQ